MVSIKMTPDIKGYSPKIIGPFSARQCVSLGVAIVGGFIISMQATFLSLDYRLYLLIPFAIIAILFGWVRLYGMPFEKFVLHLLKKARVPKTRRYVTINTFGKLDPRNSDGENKAKKRKRLTREEKKKLAAMIEKYGGIQ